jgi:hypothetical protein
MNYLANRKLRAQIKEKDNTFEEQKENIKSIDNKFEDQDKKFKYHEKRIQEKNKMMREIRRYPRIKKTSLI